MQHLKYIPKDNRFIYQGECSEVQLAQIVWHITGACKLNCVYCFGPPKKQHFSMSRIEEVLKLLKILKVQKVDISGGEPLLHHNLPDICKLLADSGISITLTTSGLGTTKNIDWLLNSVNIFRRIIFSLDSVNKEKHNLVRNHPKAFESVINLIAKVKDKGGLVRINTVVTNFLEDSKEIDNFSNYINKLQPEEWCVIEPKLGESNKDFFSGNYVATKDSLEDIMNKMSLKYKKVIFRRANDYSKYYILQPDCSFQLHSGFGVPSFSLDFTIKNLELISYSIKKHNVILPIDKE